MERKEYSLEELQKLVIDITTEVLQKLAKEIATNLYQRLAGLLLTRSPEGEQVATLSGVTRYYCPKSFECSNTVRYSCENYNMHICPGSFTCAASEFSIGGRTPFGYGPR